MSSVEDVAASSAQWMSHCQKIDTPAQSAIRQLQANTPGWPLDFHSSLCLKHLEVHFGTFRKCVPCLAFLVSKIPCVRCVVPMEPNWWVWLAEICVDMMSAVEATKASKLQALFKRRFAVR